MAVRARLLASVATVVRESLLARLSVRAPIARAATGRSDGRESGRERDAGVDREESGASEDETVRCPHCGTRNDADPTYTYCRYCVSTLRR